MRAVERPVVPNVLVEHLEEVAYLLIQRRKLLFSPEIPLRRLKEHDGRIEAHLDGLREGGSASVQIAENKLEEEDPWLLCAAARVWITQSEPSATKVMERLKGVSAETSAAWKEALRSLPREVIERVLPAKYGASLPPVVLEIAVDAWGWHRLISPDLATRLTEAANPRVRFAAARHIDDSRTTAKLLNDADPFVRRAGLWNVALKDARAAVERSHQAVRAAEPDPFAARVLGLCGDSNDARSLLPLLTHKTLGPAAMAALRDLACPRFSEALLDHLETDDEAVAAAAGEAFASLVGRLPEMEPEKQPPPGMSRARFQWQEARPKLDLNTRRLHGEAFPWQGNPADEPMEFVWRGSLTAARPETLWLRREVPDGFFTGLPSPVAVPGE
jgi:hypothetical protein